MERIALTEIELRTAELNGFSTEAKWVGFCDDCEEHDTDLRPYKYEQGVFLCEGCYEYRMEGGQ